MIVGRLTVLSDDTSPAHVELDQPRNASYEEDGVTVSRSLTADTGKTLTTVRQMISSSENIVVRAHSSSSQSAFESPCPAFLKDCVQ